jgi:hypothetical protein
METYQKYKECYPSKTDAEIIEMLDSELSEQAATVRRLIEDVGKQSIDFMRWCNEPVWRSPRALGYIKRVTVQFPTYDVYAVCDSKGNRVNTSILYGEDCENSDEFWTADEIWKYYQICNVRRAIESEILEKDSNNKV